MSLSKQEPFETTIFSVGNEGIPTYHTLGDDTLQTQK